MSAYTRWVTARYNVRLKMPLDTDYVPKVGFITPLANLDWAYEAISLGYETATVYDRDRLEGPRLMYNYDPSEAHRRFGGVAPIITPNKRSNSGLSLCSSPYALRLY